MGWKIIKLLKIEISCFLEIKKTRGEPPQSPQHRQQSECSANQREPGIKTLNFVKQWSEGGN